MSRPDDADMTAEPEGPSPSVAAEIEPTIESGIEPAVEPGIGTDGEITETDGEPDAEAPNGRRRRAYILGSAIGVLVAIVVALAFVRVPYYRFSPGTLYPTESLITIDGAKTYPSDGGRIDFTTVSGKKATVLEAFLSRFDNAVELVDAEKIDGTNPPEETRRINLEMMSDSKSNAEVVALRKLGYPIVVEGSGALVKAVKAGTPAENLLKVNDAIVAIDDTPVRLQDEAVAALGSHKPGDTITLTVESAPGEPQRKVSATLSSRCIVSGGTDPGTTLPSTTTAPAGSSQPGGTQPGGGTGDSAACSAEDAAKPMLGVTLGTRDTHFTLPFRMTIDTKEVGGPSAGLALTLGIIDVLTPGSLTGGRHVATTGTINLDGSVGPVGGIRQKTHLALREGIDLFLVPAGEEFDTATRLAEGSGMVVVAVTTLDEALAALAANGGDTDVVQQAAAANSPGSVPN